MVRMMIVRQFNHYFQDMFWILNDNNVIGNIYVTVISKLGKWEFEGWVGEGKGWVGEGKGWVGEGKGKEYSMRGSLVSWLPLPVPPVHPAHPSTLPGPEGPPPVLGGRQTTREVVCVGRCRGSVHRTRPPLSKAEDSLFRIKIEIFPSSAVRKKRRDKSECCRSIQVRIRYFTENIES